MSGAWLERIQQGQQPAPGVSEQGQLIERPVTPQGVQVCDVLSPPHGRFAAHRRAPAASLVVIQQRATAGEQIVLGEEIVVVGPRPTVQDDDRWPRPRTARKETDAVHGEHRLGRQTCGLPGCSRD